MVIINVLEAKLVCAAFIIPEHSFLQVNGEQDTDKLLRHVKQVKGLSTNPMHPKL